MPTKQSHEQGLSLGWAAKVRGTGVGGSIKGLERRGDSDVDLEDSDD
jgi:hypothetical protein